MATFASATASFYRNRVIRGRKALQGLFYKLTILLLLPWAVQPAPQRFRRMDTAAADLNVTANNANLEINKDKKVSDFTDIGESSPEGHSNSNADWIKAIAELFHKWGYKDENIPEPFGSQKTSDMEAPSPEFATILKGLEDSIPEDLKTPIKNIIHTDGIKSSEGSSGSQAKLDEIDETIKELEASLKKEPTKQPLDSDLNKIQTLTNQTGPTSILTFNTSSSETNGTKDSHKDHTTICAEQDGECDDDGYDDDELTSTETNASQPIIISEKQTSETKSNGTDKLSKDEATLDALIADLKSIMEKPKEMTVEDSSKAKQDLIQVATLVHEIESIAEHKDKPCQSMHTSDETTVKESSNHAVPSETNGSPTKATETARFTTSPPSIVATTMPAIIPDADLAENENKIANNMKHQSSLDVSIVGNAVKEVGHQLGKIAEQERERAANPSREASPEERGLIKELFKGIDDTGRKEELRDRIHPDLHKQVQDMDNLVAQINNFPVSNKQKLNIAKENPSGNQAQESPKKILASEDDDKGTGTLSETEANSISGKEDEGIAKLESIVKSKISEVSEINQAHEKHKKDMVDHIRQMKLSNNSNRNKEKIQRIEDIIEEIDQEHQRVLRLQEKLSQMTGEMIEHKHFEKHGHRSNQQTHENLENKMKSLHKIGESLTGKVGASGYDTTIEETLHTRKTVSKTSKHDQIKAEKESSSGQGTDGAEAVTESADVLNKINPDLELETTNGSDDSDSSPQGSGSGKVFHDPSPTLEDGDQKQVNSDYGALKIPQTQQFDELAREPAEVNYNGGIHEKIESLKTQYPSGVWPDSDVWNIGISDEMPDQKNVYEENPAMPYQRSDNGHENDHFDNKIEYDNESNDHPDATGSLEHIQLSEDSDTESEPHAAGHFLDKTLTSEIHKDRTRPQNGPDESLNTFDLEHELEKMENSESDRVDNLLSVLDNGPSEAKFVDFASGLSHRESLSKVEPLSPENLESIIKEEHGTIKSTAKKTRETYHHVQEHDLLDNASGTHKAKYQTRLFNRFRRNGHF